MYGYNWALCRYYTTEGGVMNNIPMVKKKELDELALRLGLKRRKWFLFIKESDKSLRLRLVERVRMISGGRLSVIGVRVGL